MDEYKDCIIAFKNGKGIALKAWKITVENADKVITVYGSDGIMAIVPLAEIKAVVFSNCGSQATINSIMEAMTA